MKYSAIKIDFKNKGSITIDNGWTDYETVSVGYQGFIVIKNGETWIAMYAIDEVFSVTLIPEDGSDATDAGEPKCPFCQSFVANIIGNTSDIYMKTFNPVDDNLSMWAVCKDNKEVGGEKYTQTYKPKFCPECGRRVNACLDTEGNNEKI